jgi:hypothetical protein
MDFRLSGLMCGNADFYVCDGAVRSCHAFGQFSLLPVARILSDHCPVIRIPATSFRKAEAANSPLAHLAISNISIK